MVKIKNNKKLAKTKNSEKLAKIKNIKKSAKFKKPLKAITNENSEINFLFPKLK